MTLNGIDISGHQASLNAGTIPADFVIIKATQGTTYVNPHCDKHFQQAVKAGKCVGVYHYISGAGADKEADFFVKNIKGYIGRAVLCLDWESYQNRAWKNEVYLERVINCVIEKTGVKPLIYTQASRLSAVQPVARRQDCGLWIAQYASKNRTGYQAHPWNEGAYVCAIRQYSDNGRLSGYSGGLDLDIFYGDRAAWDRYAKSTKVKPTPARVVLPWSERLKAAYRAQGFKAPPTLKKGARGEITGLLQEKLRDLGYKITVDKIYGFNTKGIVTAFQIANGLKPDGITGPKTWRKLGA